jgi:Flp pilus assembly protein TadD
MTCRQVLLGTAAAACLSVTLGGLAGCASPGPRMAKASDSRSDMTDRQTAKALARAEEAVAKAPLDFSARSELAHFYLRIGRFASAATTFEDVAALGGSNPRNALGLALAYIGEGRHDEATTLLREHSDMLAASDYGLAIALAGDTSRGVMVLTNAMRGGENNAKLRQNLAYAYALDGRWREARIMAGQDLPGDRLDARISQWARQARPQDYRQRVSSLLGAPMASDPGQPAALALSDALRSRAFADKGTQAFGDSFGAEELEAVADEPFTAPAAPPPPSAAFAPARPSVTFISRPVIQGMPDSETSPQTVAEPKLDARPVALREAASLPVAAGTASSHLVQLGSFLSRDEAEESWTVFVSRDPQLGSHGRSITEAVVNGRRYFRVAATGFDPKTASAFCDRVKARGQGCVPYAAKTGLYGAKGKIASR